MARAKRTDRTEARRRHREQAVLAGAEPGLEPDDAEATAATARASRGSGRAPSRAAAPAPPQQRPSITAAFKAAYRPPKVAEDLRALPQVLTSWGFLAAVGLTIAAGAWFVLAYDAAMASYPVGGASREELEAVVAGNSIPYFVGQMAFLSPPPAIGAFLIGFAAKRASWLGGLIYGAFVVALVALLLSTNGGRLMTLDTPETNQLVLTNHAAFSPIGAALFAAAAAWYRRFLQLSNPNRRPQQQPRRPQGRGDMKPARR